MTASSLTVGSKYSLLALALLSLAACGGGGGGGGSGGGSSNPTPGGNNLVSPVGGDGSRFQPAPEIGTGSFSISGQLTPAAAIFHDSDVNDMFTTLVSNDSLSTAQALDSNVGTVHGFVSYDAYMGDYGFTGGHFLTEDDEFDVYKVSLQARQLIELQNVDFSGYDLPRTGDVDISLLDASGNMVAESNSVDEFESIFVQTSGEYYIVVEAYEGISKYVMRLHRPFSSMPQTKQISGDFVAGDVILRMRQPANMVASSAKRDSVPVTLDHTSKRRAALGKIQTVQQKAIRKGTAVTGPDGWAKMETLRAIKDLRQRDDVISAEPNLLLQPLRIPNDEYYGLQWHYPMINLPQAWEVTTGARAPNPVIVAVNDTGVVYDHPDMRGQTVAGYDFISDPDNARDGDGMDDDPWDVGDSPNRGSSSYHGTHVAGTIAALSDNEVGMAGVAWDAKIMPLRVLGAQGGAQYDVIQSLYFAAALPNASGKVPPVKADIINLSLGGVYASAEYNQAIQEVIDAGVIIVAATGNDAENGQVGVISYPAGYDRVISVGAVNSEGTRAAYSQYGPGIDLVAPGGGYTDMDGDGKADGVWSLFVDDTDPSVLRGVYMGMSGTSMATPHVAGVLALMKSIYPELTQEQVLNLIQAEEITNDVGPSGADEEHGYGLIDAYKAVRAAQQLAAGGTPEPVDTGVTVSPSIVNLETASEGQFRLQADLNSGESVIEISSSETWLSITPAATDAQGMGDYRVNVNRAGLVDGFYSSAVVVKTSSYTLNLTVNMQVGSVDSAGDLAQQYIGIMDVDTMQLVGFTLSETVNGVQRYRFDDIPSGRYVIMSSTDIDGDTVVCVSGEACGVYPEAIDTEVYYHTEDKTDLNIVINVLGGNELPSAMGGALGQSASGRLKAEKESK